MEELTLTATVTATSPLTVIVDGADTANPATAADDLGALTVGDRVVLNVRVPNVPIVTSIEVEV